MGLFSTEPEFEEKLEWIRNFVREEIEPLEVIFPPSCEFLPLNDERRRIVDPLKQKVRDQGLWAPHLGPELGGQGFGAVKLTLINEILGRATWSSIIFGTQAPDTGNAEILARFGTEEQKEQYLTGLLSGEIFSTFSMTEPQGGSDPRVFTTRAVRDGDDWVINGRKYWSSNASVASFFHRRRDHRSGRARAQGGGVDVPGAGGHPPGGQDRGDAPSGRLVLSRSRALAGALRQCPGAGVGDAGR